MRISSQAILQAETASFKPGTIECSPSGEILSIAWDNMDGEWLPGIISPGFINTHCHLELSHLKGKVDEKTGMAGFISDLILLRSNISEEQIQEAMRAADAEMYRNGIVAVGDISNTVLSYGIKAESSLYYHTFIELFDLHPSKTEEAFQRGIELVKSFGKLPVSLAPHAPYTVTPGLFKRISEWHQGKSLPSCIHHQESDAENDFFRHRGKIWSFFKSKSMDLSWVPTFNTSLDYINTNFHVPLLQYVHNTVLSTFDLRSSTFLCTCPNANLYIESRLPDYQNWIKGNLKVTIGTDSLASNHHLGLHHEIQTIRKAYPEIPLELLLTWATRNGAEYLGVADRFGTLEKGKKPGILQLTGTNPGEEMSVKRLA